MNQTHTERGAALIGAVLIIVILPMLATVSLNVAAQEIESVAAAKDEAVAWHLAEAGADLAMQWFHDPSFSPEGAGRRLFTKQQEGPDGSPSFFDAAGRSQFTGTENRPDILYDAARPADDRLLNDPSVGWFRSLGALGRITRLAVHGPTSPGLLCTVQVTTEARRLARTITVQLAARPWPPIQAGVQIGANGSVQAVATPLPVSVHWGDFVVNGDVRLGAVQDVPVKTDLAPVTGQSYDEMNHREDRWLDLFIGGEALFAPLPTGPAPVPVNVHVHQEPTPGLRQDRWDYQTMKDAALRDGTYYVRGQDGLLYRHGLIESGLGVTVTDAFQSGAVGDHRGLVFVDTLDCTPPRADNLGTLVVDAEYMEGVFVINAHVRFAPTGMGKSMPAHTPVLEGQGATEPRTSVQLTGIQLRGALITAGNLAIVGPARVYGAMIVGGAMEQASDTGAHLEVWYDDDFRTGFF
ncbi:MAG: hypothetical protein EXR96_08105 [Nitrospiraceae bacterium]|nr:hypothetical protein [Nitrospiraceae bacterium]